MKLKIKEHPVLKGLFVNENGTEIVYNGKKLEIKKYKLKGKHYQQKQVNFKGITVTVPKLVCETFNGMRESKLFTLHRKDFDPTNDHYTNLYWGVKGNTSRTHRSSRPKNSKIKRAEIPEVVKRILAGETLKNIGRSYNTSDMAIYRIKARFITNSRLRLKEAVMHAKNKFERLKAYAKHFGYNSYAEAVAYCGKYEFLTLVNKTAKAL